MRIKKDTLRNNEVSESFAWGQTVQQLNDVSPTHLLDGKGDYHGIQHEKYIYQSDGISGRVDFSNITINTNYDFKVTAYLKGNDVILFSTDADDVCIFQMNSQTVFVRVGSEFNKDTGSLAVLADAATAYHKYTIARVEGNITVYIDDIEYPLLNNENYQGSIPLSTLFSRNKSVYYQVDCAYVSLEIEGNLILEYKCEEQLGTIAYDSSGNGNNGTFIGGVTHNSVRFYKPNVNIPLTNMNVGSGTVNGTRNLSITNGQINVSAVGEGVHRQILLSSLSDFDNEDIIELNIKCGNADLFIHPLAANSGIASLDNATSIDLNIGNNVILLRVVDNTKGIAFRSKEVTTTAYTVQINSLIRKDFKLINYTNEYGYSNGVNYLKYSEDLTDSYFFAFRLNRTLGSQVEGITLTNLEANATNSSGSAVGRILSGTTSSTYTFSVYAKADNSNYISLRLSNNASFADRSQVWFDLSNGTVGTVSSAGNSFETANADIIPIGSGLYRCSITFTTNTDIDISCRIYLVNGDNSNAVTIGASVDVGGCQFEQNNTITNYQRTENEATLNKIIPRITNSNLDALDNDCEFKGKVALDAELIESNCLISDGISFVGTFNFDLTGIVLTNQGTAVITVDEVNNTITMGSGTIFNIVLNTGEIFPIAEGLGTTTYAFGDLNKNISWRGTIIWGTQDEFHHNINNGFHNQNGVFLPVSLGSNPKINGHNGSETKFKMIFRKDLAHSGLYYNSSDLASKVVSFNDLINETNFIVLTTLDKTKTYLTTYKSIFFEKIKIISNELRTNTNSLFRNFE